MEKFIINKIWSDGFCERYALVKRIGKEQELGVYFLINDRDVNAGDVLNGDLVIDCAKIIKPVQLDNNMEMTVNFDTIHDTDVTANVTLKSIESKKLLHGYINPDFSDIKIIMINDFPSDSFSCGDEVTVKGLLTLELSEP